MTERPPSANSPPGPEPDPGSTIRLGNAAIKVNRSSVGITLQTSTLLALLGIGWNAKGALEEQLARLDAIEAEVERRYDELDKSVLDLQTRVSLAQASAEQLVQLQVANAQLRGEVVAAEQRLDALERLVERLDRKGGR